MRILNYKIHGILDYVVVVVFALAPTIFGLNESAATISYILAIVHLLLTLMTASIGIAAIVPLTVHGLIELIVSILLIVLPIGAGFTGTSRNFYLAAGIVIFVVWLMTNYRGGKKLESAA